MKANFIELFKSGLIKGAGIAAGFITTGLLAATVAGTIHSFATNEIIDADKFNVNFASLKTAVEAIDPQFSATETATHMRWIDGRTIYRRVISMGTLPNTTSKGVAHGIGVSFTPTRLYGMAHQAAGPSIPLPFSTPTLNQNILFHVDNTNINITTNGDHTVYTSSYAILEYVKD